MENINQYDELLVRYLADALNAEEKHAVEAWLNENEQNRKYFEEIKNAWQVAGLHGISEKINVNDEWIHFTNNVSTAENEQGAEVEIPKRRGIVFRLIVSGAVAASVLLIVMVGLKFFHTDNKTLPVAELPKADTGQAFVVLREANTTGRDKTIRLSDGSEVILANKSSIAYVEPFSRKRDIDLVGKALFKVAKGQAVPFTVTGRDIVTTALGTEFSVTVFEKENVISVKLFESKVVVKATGAAKKNMKSDVYLLPGQELVYDYNTGVTIRNFETKKGREQATASDRNETDSLEMADKVEGSWYMFNNQSLEQVLTSLSALYNVKIAYNKKDVEKIYFTGKYNKTDSLATILKRISAINKLTVTKNDTAFVIRK